MKVIEELIPHRPPFLFIDEITELSETRLVAKRTVRPDEPWLAGHFPGRPIMPGVLLCEAALQAGACLMASRMEHERGVIAGIPVVARIQEARFKRMVKPGDLLHIIAEYERTTLDAHFLSGRIEVDGALAASLSYTVMMAPAGEF